MTPHDPSIIGLDDPILVTGAAGFIGTRVVEQLLQRGFRNIRAFVRPSSDLTRLESARRASDGAGPTVIRGNLLSRLDCAAACKDVAVVFHLAAGRGEKSVPDAFVNSVVTTRNLLEACVEHARLRRFVNVSSLSVYSNLGPPRGVLDEGSALETRPQLRGDAYSFAKVKQDELVMDYTARFGVPVVTVRPGYVYGPGKEAITGRVGVGGFGVFLHLGGGNPLPLTYVDNCAEAIILAGLRAGIDGEVFNVVDDDLPSSRRFLRLYKANVRRFPSIYVPHAASYALSWLWEAYARWSQNQLPPVYNRCVWHTYWKRTRYSNAHLKERLGWTPSVATAEGLRRYFAACRERFQHA
jgi:nucleoside-diphosphate-sugar epimerase